MLRTYTAERQTLKQSKQTMETKSMQEMIAELNLHFEKIKGHPTVLDNDYRQSSLSTFNGLINQYKPESPEEKTVAELLRG